MSKREIRYSEMQPGFSLASVAIPEGRLIIVVSGAPAAGKTTLATAVAKARRLPVIGKDDIKETLVDALDGLASDPGWSRRIGGAAMQVLWRLDTRQIGPAPAAPA